MVLYWYPKCSTCRKAKKYLDDHHCNYELKDLTIDTPSEKELKKYINTSGKDTKKFFNTSGLSYRKNNLKDKIAFLSDDEMIKLLASDGMLIKRPILIVENDVYVGFSEKEWSELL